MPISNWSTTAANNDDADISAGVDWREGQLPATVNNSSRAEMAQVRTWYDQVMAAKHRSVVATGTGAAYVLTPSPAITAYSSGLQFTFSVPTASTTTAPSLNVSALGAKTLKQRGGALKASGVLQAGDIVEAFYDGTDFQMSNLWDGQAINGYDAELSRYNIKDYSIENTTPSSSSGTLTLDLENGNDFDVTLDENVTTITVNNWPASGVLGKFTLAFTQDGTGSWTVAFPAGWKSPQNETYTVTTTATTGHDEFVVWSRDGGTTVYFAAVGQNFS